MTQSISTNDPHHDQSPSLKQRKVNAPETPFFSPYSESTFSSSSSFLDSPLARKSSENHWDLPSSRSGLQTPSKLISQLSIAENSNRLGLSDQILKDHGKARKELEPLQFDNILQKESPPTTLHILPDQLTQLDHDQPKQFDWHTIPKFSKATHTPVDHSFGYYDVDDQTNDPFVSQQGINAGVVNHSENEASYENDLESEMTFESDLSSDGNENSFTIDDQDGYESDCIADSVMISDDSNSLHIEDLDSSPVDNEDNQSNRKECDVEIESDCESDLDDQLGSTELSLLIAQESTTDISITTETLNTTPSENINLSSIHKEPDSFSDQSNSNDMDSENSYQNFNSVESIVFDSVDQISTIPLKSSGFEISVDGDAKNILENFDVQPIHGKLESDNVSEDDQIATTQNDMVNTSPKQPINNVALLNTPQLLQKGLRSRRIMISPEEPGSIKSESKLPQSIEGQSTKRQTLDTEHINSQLQEILENWDEFRKQTTNTDATTQDLVYIYFLRLLASMRSTVKEEHEQASKLW
ncbi:hypothetical protein BC833DRAFT_599779 [Globomyces pollinis-pini]|nr:hypothetical protein BC833DRAFT_599779 [Globomyces pollinis-pini]